MCQPARLGLAALHIQGGIMRLGSIELGAVDVTHLPMEAYVDAKKKGGLENEGKKPKSHLNHISNERERSKLLISADA